MIKIITTGAKSVLPFSPAIKAGDFVYVSGQASVDRENGSVIEGTFEEEMRRSIENLEVILKEAGLTLDHVINVKGYVADQKDLKEYNKIYPEYFKDPLPTRIGEPSDIGGAAVFLASEEAKYITGQMLYVDGGILANQLNWDESLL